MSLTEFFILMIKFLCYILLEVALVAKNGPAKAGDKRDAGLIPGSGRSLEEGMATHSSIPAWEISWIEEPGGLQYMGSQSQT